MIFSDLQHARTTCDLLIFVHVFTLELPISTMRVKMMLCFCFSIGPTVRSSIYGHLSISVARVHACQGA